VTEPMIDLEVDLIHRERGIAILSDGQEVPITAWFSAPDALPCEPKEAASCVAGPDFDGRWYAVDLTKFTGQVH
jgi:hypothetical protein